MRLCDSDGVGGLGVEGPFDLEAVDDEVAVAALLAVGVVAIDQVIDVGGGDLVIAGGEGVADRERTGVVVQLGDVEGLDVAVVEANGHARRFVAERFLPGADADFVLAPECFAYLHATTTSQFKRFREGLDQLLQEGVVQVLQLRNTANRAPLLAAVGPLQFEVVQYRLQSEYGAESRLENASWDLLRWVDPAQDLDALEPLLPSGGRLAYDAKEQPVILFPTEWSLNYFTKQNKTISISDVPFNSNGN